MLTDAKHGDHTHFELVTVTVTTADGATGCGYTYTGGKGGHAIAAMITHDLAPALCGTDSALIEKVHVSRTPTPNPMLGYHVMSASLSRLSPWGLHGAWQCCAPD